MTDSFPRLSARTQRFTLGLPRALEVPGDGSTVLFLRAASGTDATTSLWRYDVAAGSESLLVDAAALLAGVGEDLSPEERSRRERAREGAAGVVAYASDRAGDTVCCALSGRLVVADADGAREVPVVGPVFDPHLDPTGQRIAFVSGRALHVVDLEGSPLRTVVEDDEQVSWGRAEFIAAEEMDRLRGFWWSPDGTRLLAARVDETPVQRWWVADAAEPARPPVALAYPAAGTANADVRLAILDLEDGRVDVEWDRAAFPYLAQATWEAGAPPTLLVVARDQRRLQVLTVDPDTGATTVAHRDEDPVWVEVAPGVPAWSGRRLVMTADRDGARRLLLDGTPVTPTDLQVREVLDVTTDSALLAVSFADPAEVHVVRVGLPCGETERLTEVPGVHGGAAGGDTVVLRSVSLDAPGVTVEVRRGDEPAGSIASYAVAPPLTPRVALLHAGERRLRTALLLPTGWCAADGPLPVLMDPYGGPHAQRVLAARSAFLTSQWFADQGFAVVIVDGRGTPGRGPEWEREVSREFASVTLADQVDGLHAVAAEHPELDLSRVAIRGWSYGGYLAALAVLRRPDVFHAAVAGAPVTDWRLYDTHYTERYLGHPDEEPEAYVRNSLLDDAPRLTRPLLIVHGLGDDNVIAAHSLRLSRALLEAGRPHTFLPLSGVTHMTPQEVVAENLLRLQVAFLRSSLGMDPVAHGQTEVHDGA